MKRRGSRWLGAVLLTMGAAVATTAVAEDPVEDLAIIARREAASPKDLVAVLRGVDKISARVTDIEAPLNTPMRYGSLEILARTCSKRPPEETPEVTAFLEIADVKADGQKDNLFSGWMFASSPALSALEHPVYDVWVIDCKTRSPRG
ncbi:DUF2155 domain-containing protein [Iodidimonas sp. SYSU 1G8]|uniref:DUF2155 domain-containing protein n=1 Tax=Iodidimonas sp. SYSU 1G8 TaxID=3133967 RepID=UPI0031FE4B68